MNSPDERKYSLDALPGDDWEVRFTKQVTREIARYRDLRGLSTLQLAERCSAAYGEPGKVKGNTLNGLFAGKRKSIGIAEVMIFAQALSVPPIALLFPTSNEPVEVSPNQFAEMSAFDGYLWFIGRAVPESTNDRKAFQDVRSVFSRLDDASTKQVEVVVMNAEMIATDRAEAEVGFRSSWPATTDDDLRAAIENLALQRERLRAIGTRPPALPPYLAFIDNEPLEFPARLPITNGLTEPVLEYVEKRAAKYVIDLKFEADKDKWEAAVPGPDEFLRDLDA